MFHLGHCKVFYFNFNLFPSHFILSQERSCPINYPSSFSSWKCKKVWFTSLKLSPDKQKFEVMKFIKQAETSKLLSSNELPFFFFFSTKTLNQAFNQVLYSFLHALNSAGMTFGLLSLKWDSNWSEQIVSCRTAGVSQVLYVPSPFLNSCFIMLGHLKAHPFFSNTCLLEHSSNADKLLKELQFSS